MDRVEFTTPCAGAVAAAAVVVATAWCLLSFQLTLNFVLLVCA
jgi:hypothetical protein